MSESDSKHFDVGIAGVWFGGNYGSVLTYFALRETIMRMGYSVAMIDKPGADHNDPEFSPKIHSRVFAREHGYDVLPVPSKDDMGHLNDACDSFVIGSDQVWNYGVGGGPGFGPMMYLGFADFDKTLISYASSFGHKQSFTPIDALPKITKYLQRIDHVSVRENDGVDILKNEFGVRGTQVLDPIYLLERSDYEALIRDEDTADYPKEYLLAYVLGKNGGTFELDAMTMGFLRSQAESKGLKLVVLADARKKLPSQEKIEQMKREMKADMILQCSSISQWLGSIKNSSYFITDSFHGAGFGLLFKRQMLICGNRSRGMSRFTSLAALFDLWNVLGTSLHQLKARAKANPAIDYEYVDSVLQMEKERSTAWLAEALRNRRPKPVTIDAVPPKECCGCMACVNACPTDCISMVQDLEHCLYPSIDESACIRCGKCLKACPSIHIQLDKEVQAKLYASYTTEDVRMVSSSGGIFSLAADQVLSEGGKVFGAAFDENLVLHQVSAQDQEGLAALRASKYIQSQADLTYREAKEALKVGKPVLYVGCPCQVAGLNTYLGKEYPNLLTIDLLCHGGPSPYSFERYLEEVHGDREVAYVGFRDKDYFGWSTEMTVKYAEGEPFREKRNKDIFYRAFLPCLSVRPHCQVCNFSRLPRQGDLTLGDFWGVSKYDPKLTDGNGTSIVSVNSPRGKKLYEDFSSRLAVSQEIDREWVLTHGQPYARPFKNNPRRYRFQRMLRNLSFRKSLECCSKNRFDFALMELGFGSYGQILEQYALEQAVERTGYTVLAAYEPLEEVYAQGSPSPLKHRLVDFANWYYPAISTYDKAADQKMINTVAHGLVTLGASDHVEGLCKYPCGPFDYGTEVIAAGGVSPVFLLRGDDWDAIAKSAQYEDPKAPYAAVYVRDAGFDGSALNGLGFVDIAADMSVGDWVSRLMAAEVLITDRVDGALIAAAMEKPAILLSNNGTDLQEGLERAGLRASVVHASALPKCESADELLSLSGRIEVTGSLEATQGFLEEGLKAHWTEKLYYQPDLKKEMRKLERKAKDFAKKVLRRLGLRR